MDIKTVAEVVDPLKTLGETVLTNFKTSLSKMGDVLGGALASAWNKIPGSSAVSTAISSTASALGQKFGLILGEGAAANAGAAFAANLPSFLLPFLSGAGFIGGAALGGAVALGASHELTTQFKNDNGPLGTAFGAVTLIAHQTGTTAGHQLAAAIGPTLANGFRTDVAPVAMAGGTDTGKAFVQYSATTISRGADVVTGAMKSVLQGDAMMQAGAQAGLTAATTLAQNFKDQMARESSIFNASARGIDGDLAKALEGNRGLVKTAMDKVRFALKHPYALMRDQARIEGAITHIQYLESLAGVTPGQKTIFDQQIAFLEAQWTNISGKAYVAGGDAQQSYNQGLQNAPPPHIQIPHAPGFNPGQINRYNPPHRGSGGPALAGHTYTVNEHGTEYLHMGNQSGYISPAGAPPIHVVSVNELERLLDRRSGQRLALASTAPYTRN
jgi:hypothetical protein